MNIFFKNKEDLKLINAVNFILGYKPKKIQLYKLALLHKSNNSEESNERLEYLGDAVLGLIVANYLFKLYPYKDEGFLTKIRSKIVSRDSLNNLGRKIGIKELINLQKAKTNFAEEFWQKDPIAVTQYWEINKDDTMAKLNYIFEPAPIWINPEAKWVEKNSEKGIEILATMMPGDVHPVFNAGYSASLLCFPSLVKA